MLMLLQKDKIYWSLIKANILLSTMFVCIKIVIKICNLKIDLYRKKQR